jgi:hypothetical protein
MVVPGRALYSTRGGILVDEIMDMYLELGETWENDPLAYVEAFEGQRGAFSAALNNLDVSEMVESWSDDTLYDVELHGSDLAFTKAQRLRIMQAVVQERAERGPGTIADGLTHEAFGEYDEE